MTKALPIVGIIGAVFAALVVAVLANAGLFLVVAVAFGGSLVLLGQRSVAGAAAGLVILAVAAIAGLGLAESIATKNGTFEAFSPATGRVLATLSCVLLPVAAMLLRWDLLQPRWLGYGGLGAAAIGFLLAATDPTDLTDHGTWRTAVTAVFLLAAAAPMVVLLKAPAPDADVEAAEAPMAGAPTRRP